MNTRWNMISSWKRQESSFAEHRRYFHLRGNSVKIHLNLGNLDSIATFASSFTSLDSDIIILGFTYIFLIREDCLDNFQGFLLFWISNESHWLLSGKKNKNPLPTKCNIWNKLYKKHWNYCFFLRFCVLCLLNLNLFNWRLITLKIFFKEKIVSI